MTQPRYSKTAVERCHRLIQDHIDQGHLPGAALLLWPRDSEPDYTFFGYADYEKKRPLTHNALYWIASTTKSVTAAAAMTLVDQGGLELDQPIDLYLPTFTNIRVEIKDSDYAQTRKSCLQPPQRLPTARECLSCHSGWPTLTPFMSRHGTDVFTTELARTSYELTPLQQEPGAGFLYSSVGFNIVALIIEKITGQTFPDYLSQTFFQPLGMTDTTFWPNAEQQKRLVKTYIYNQETDTLKPFVNNYLHSSDLSNRGIRGFNGGGGLFSTIQDIGVFFHMLHNGGEYAGQRYISQQSIDMMRTAQQNSDYGFGIRMTQTPPQWGHGGLMGTKTYIQSDIDCLVSFFVQCRGLDNDADIFAAICSELRQ